MTIVPDECGITRIDLLTQAIHQYLERLACLAFDPAPPRRRRPAGLCDRGPKGLLRNVIGAAGAEGIVSKRAGSAYRGGPRRDWLKVKVSETAAFAQQRLTRVRQVVQADEGTRLVARTL
jgi:hypothetical protein